MKKSRTYRIEGGQTYSTDRILIVGENEKSVHFVLNINKILNKNSKRVLDDLGREWVFGLCGRPSLKKTDDKKRKELNDNWGK